MSVIRHINRLGLALAVFVLCNTPVWAGPGGAIAKAAVHSTWGRIVIAALVVFFLPLITYILLTERLAERRTLRDLAYMAARESSFDWLRIRERVIDCFFRVHRAWSEEDVSTVAGWMEDWYWQNQQLVHLNNWQRQGLVNVCNVKKITSIRPLYFSPRNAGAGYEDSMLVVLICSHMQDWLEKRETGETVEGDRGWKDVEALWTFRLSDGVWRVANIEDGSMSLHYAKLVKQLPKIEQVVRVGA